VNQNLLRFNARTIVNPISLEWNRPINIGLPSIDLSGLDSNARSQVITGWGSACSSHVLSCFSVGVGSGLGF
jgi:hypothetical protein